LSLIGAQKVTIKNVAIQVTLTLIMNVLLIFFFHLFVEKGGAKTIDGPRRFP
jgi:hypothetical protein